MRTMQQLYEHKTQYMDFRLSLKQSMQLERL